MELLRDLSIVYSFVHIFIMFQALFESRYPKKKAKIISACFVIPLIVINWLLFLKLGYEGYGTLMLLTLTHPQGIMYWILSKHRDGRFFFTYCMVDTVALEIFYVTNLINYYTTPNTYIVMFLLRLVLYPLIEIWAFKNARHVSGGAAAYQARLGSFRCDQYPVLCGDHTSDDLSQFRHQYPDPSASAHLTVYPDAGNLHSLHFCASPSAARP